MKEQQAIVEAFERFKAENKKVALATVVEVRGSSYRRPGARMLITDSGEVVGGVSGGCLERDVCKRGKQVIATGESTLVIYDTTSESDIVWGLGLGCNGVVKILLEPLRTDARQVEHIAFLKDCIQQRRQGVVATVYEASDATTVKPGQRLMLSSDGREATGDIEDLELFAMVEIDAQAALCERRSSARVYEAGSAKVFMEFIRPPQSLVIFGAGHDALPLTEFAKALGWHVTLIDSRPAYATTERFSCADRIITARPEDACEHLLPEVSESAAVVMTHNYLHDLEVLRKLLPSPVKYIGLLGPRKRTEKLLRQLAVDGATLTGEQLARLHAPVGLDIGAETSEQIALAIVAEIQAALTDRYGGMLKSRERPIHREAEDSSPSGRSVANVCVS